MAVAYQTSNTNSAGSANSLALTKPSGVVDGDLLIVAIAFRDNGSGMTTLSGWTNILTQASDGSGSFTTLAIFYKIASSEPSSYTWAIGLTTLVIGSIIRINGQNASGFIDVKESGGAAGFTTSLSFGSGISPTKSESLLLQFWSAFNLNSNVNSVSNEAIATSNPSWTEAFDIDVSNGGQHQGLAMAYATRTATSSTGASSATAGVNAGSYCGALLVIRRVTDFSASPADTVTDTDNIISSAGFKKTVTDTVTDTDAVVATKSRAWTNGAKNSNTSWVNDQKS